MAKYLNKEVLQELDEYRKRIFTERQAKKTHGGNFEDLWVFTK